MHFTIFADGGARGNPGPAGSGAVVRDEKGKTVATVSEFLGHTTNNVAEYTAILCALETLAAQLGDRTERADISVYMDSKLVVEQMNGNYKIKHPNLKPLASRVKELIPRFKAVTFAHVPRERNKDADALANEAMDRGS
ncbi:MAG: reverse transcriptase-like protein [Patescibacteria group bacterium]|nr:reverse transcriptase-like protein [Patescibacteria group bacterium]MDE1966043.1 reverse transcriptase-like protein [Patescibacteria group bacterium]